MPQGHHHKKRKSGRRSGGSTRRSSSLHAHELEDSQNYSDCEDDDRQEGHRNSSSSSRRKSTTRKSRGSSSRRSSAKDQQQQGAVDKRSQMISQRSSKRHQSSRELKESTSKLNKQKSQRASSQSSARHIYASKDPNVQVAERVTPAIDPLTNIDMVSKLVENMGEDDLEVVSKLLNTGKGKDKGRGQKKKKSMEDDSDNSEESSYFSRLSSKKKYALVAGITFTATVVIAVCVVMFGFAQKAINASSASGSNVQLLDIIKFSPLLTGNLTIGTLPGAVAAKGEGEGEEFYLNIHSVNFSIFDEDDLVLYITRGNNDTLIETRQLQTHFRFEKIALLKMPIKLPFEFFPGEYAGIILSDENEMTQRRIELVQSPLETIDDDRDAMQPSGQPTSSMGPTERPSISPTERPSISPTRNPTLRPSHVPSMVPSISPSTSPPSMTPTDYPTVTPRPTRLYSDAPTDIPSQNPTADNRLTRLEEVLTATLGRFPNPATSSTPQAKAVQWLAEGGPGSNLNLKGPEQNILKHFAVLTQWYSTNPSGWTTLDNSTIVNPSKPLCDWEGVKCSTVAGQGGIGEEEIVALEWPEINMQGTMATELGFLTALTALDFHDNLLRGSVPTELEGLTNLKVFDVGGNQLTGALPKVNNNQGGLETLDLGQNSGLSGNLVSYASTLPRTLKLFSCGGCQLAGTIPIQLRSLQALTKLDLSGAGIEGNIPSNLAELPQMKELDLHGNKLTGQIHPRLATMTNLEILDFSSNQLTGAVISELGNLPSLRRLELQTNALRGNIPFSIVSMRTLTDLDLSNNQIAGNLPRLSGASLRSVHVNNNLGITGNMGVIFANAPVTLNDFGCSRCQLTGLAIPTAMQKLNLRETGLSGPITTVVNQLRLENLISIELQYNALTGRIPTQLLSSPTVETVRLNNNLLSGSIPSLANGPSLKAVDFSDNNGLFGDTFTILNSLGPQVTRFSCNNCTLGGALTDASLATLPNLEVLELERTGLSGPIPNTFGNLKSLIELDLRKNSMTGTVPSSLATSSQVRKLKLGKNQLTASLASFTGSSLEELSLEDNLSITGDLTAFFSSVSKTLVEFDCDQCKVPGPLPGSLLRDFPNLKVLKLEQAGLNGPIPTELGRMSQLSNLDLGMNRLVGTIPEAIGDIPTLVELQLNFNLLVGDIPVFSSQILKKINLNDNIGLRGRVDAFLESFPALTMTEIMCEDCILEGSLPPSISRFRNLEVLRLDKGGILQGSLPTQMAQLTKLRRLDVSRNVITGVIPAQFRDLRTLEELDVGDNYLRGTVPAFLGDLSNLEDVFLGHNLFSGTIPRSLGSLPKIKIVDISDNDLSGPIPPFTADSLRNLDLSDNTLLDGRLDWILGNMTDKILSFSCEDCALPGSIPSNLIARKTSLEYIKLQDCDLVGNIPTVFGRLSNLTHIDLSENDLVGKLPTQIAQLSKLSRFDVYNNQLTGAIPRFRSLSNLQLLDLGKNLFVIDAFTVFDTLPTSLTELFFDETPLAGTLPYTGIQSFSSLEFFGVRGCNLYGRLPLFNGLQNLTVVRLSENTLSGTIPASYGQLTKLESLDLSSNDIFGNIPNFGNARRLREADFSYNIAIVGSPDRIFQGMPESLEDFRCQLCGLTGAIPGQSMTRFRNLTGILLQENTLTGQLPTHLGSLTKLSRLSLGGNALVGTIPTQIASLPRLEIFDLWGNQLSGAVPSFAQNDGFLSFFDIEDNLITGSLSSILQALPPESLQKFYAGYNQITGFIPAEIASFPKLRVFDIQFASVGGTVPMQMAFMNQMEELRLEGNGIGGVFPAGIANIRTLVKLTIHANRFSGSLDAVCFANAGVLPFPIDMTADCSNPVLVSCSCCSECWMQNTGGFPLV
ncbi:MAG: hypothetical protein SGBAC_011143 [Bacillariaceae sp.]